MNISLVEGVTVLLSINTVLVVIDGKIMFAGKVFFGAHIDVAVVFSV